VHCNDGLDNNGGWGIDAADPSCALPAYAPACPAGSSLQIRRNLTQVPILDNTPAGATSTITVPAGVGTITQVAVLFDVSHLYVSDVDVSLTPPGGVVLDLCSDNGGSGDHFVRTVLAPQCTTPVTSGVAPFSGCYAPEAAQVPALAGTSPVGAWTLRAADDATGIAGTLDGWALLLCTAP
jgi:subtilisin-like proprotein convertase family protein